MDTSDARSTEPVGRGGAGPGPRQAVTDPAIVQGREMTEEERFVWLLRHSSVAQKAVSALADRATRTRVDDMETRMNNRLRVLALDTRTTVTRALGEAMINLGGAGRRAASNVASYPASFKFALFAVFVLFCAVSYLCVEHVRGAMVRAEERDAMHVLLDEARTSVAQVAGAQEEIATHGRAITGLLDETQRNTSFRQSYEAFDFPTQVDALQTQMAVLQLTVEELREDTDARLRASRRATQEVAHRVAPIEAVTLTNRTRYYRGPLDEMANTRCTDAKRSASRASPDFHVRACTDGFNGQEYLLWCAQKHRGALESERFSGCTSTDPYHRS